MNRLDDIFSQRPDLLSQRPDLLAVRDDSTEFDRDKSDYLNSVPQDAITATPLGWTVTEDSTVPDWQANTPKSNIPIDDPNVPYEWREHHFLTKHKLEQDRKMLTQFAGGSVISDIDAETIYPSSLGVDPYKSQTISRGDSAWDKLASAPGKIWDALKQIPEKLSGSGGKMWDALSEELPKRLSEVPDKVAKTFEESDINVWEIPGKVYDKLHDPWVSSNNMYQSLEDKYYSRWLSSGTRGNTYTLFGKTYDIPVDPNAVSPYSTLSDKLARLELIDAKVEAEKQAQRDHGIPEDEVVSFIEGTEWAELKLETDRLVKNIKKGERYGGISIWDWVSTDLIEHYREELENYQLITDDGTEPATPIEAEEKIAVQIDNSNSNIVEEEIAVETIEIMQSNVSTDANGGETPSKVVLPEANPEIVEKTQEALTAHDKEYTTWLEKINFNAAREKRNHLLSVRNKQDDYLIGNTQDILLLALSGDLSIERQIEALDYISNNMNTLMKRVSKGVSSKDRIFATLKKGFPELGENYEEITENLASLTSDIRLAVNAYHRSKGDPVREMQEFGLSVMREFVTSRELNTVEDMHAYAAELAIVGSKTGQFTHEEVMDGLTYYNAIMGDAASFIDSKTRSTAAENVATEFNEQEASINRGTIGGRGAVTKDASAVNVLAPSASQINNPEEYLETWLKQAHAIGTTAVGLSLKQVGLMMPGVDTEELKAGLMTRYTQQFINWTRGYPALNVDALDIPIYGTAFLGSLLSMTGRGGDWRTDENGMPPDNVRMAFGHLVNSLNLGLENLRRGVFADDEEGMRQSREIQNRYYSALYTIGDLLNQSKSTGSGISRDKLQAALGMDKKTLNALDGYISVIGAFTKYGTGEGSLDSWLDVYAAYSLKYHWDSNGNIYKPTEEDIANMTEDERYIYDMQHTHERWQEVMEVDPDIRQARSYLVGLMTNTLPSSVQIEIPAQLLNRRDLPVNKDEYTAMYFNKTDKVMNTDKVQTEIKEWTKVIDFLSPEEFEEWVTDNPGFIDQGRVQDYLELNSQMESGISFSPLVQARILQDLANQPGGNNLRLAHMINSYQLISGQGLSFIDAVTMNYAHPENFGKTMYHGEYMDPDVVEGMIRRGYNYDPTRNRHDQIGELLFYTPVKGDTGDPTSWFRSVMFSEGRFVGPTKWLAEGSYGFGTVPSHTIPDGTVIEQLLFPHPTEPDFILDPPVREAILDWQPPYELVDEDGKPTGELLANDFSYGLTIDQVEQGQLGASFMNVEQNFKTVRGINLSTGFMQTLLDKNLVIDFNQVEDDLMRQVQLGLWNNDAASNTEGTDFDGVVLTKNAEYLLDNMDLTDVIGNGLVNLMKQDGKFDDKGRFVSEGFGLTLADLQPISIENRVSIETIDEEIKRFEELLETPDLDEARKDIGISSAPLLQWGMNKLARSIGLLDLKTDEEMRTSINSSLAELEERRTRLMKEYSIGGGELKWDDLEDSLYVFPHLDIELVPYENLETGELDVQIFVLGAETEGLRGGQRNRFLFGTMPESQALGAPIAQTSDHYREIREHAFQNPVMRATKTDNKMIFQIQRGPVLDPVTGKLTGYTGEEVPQTQTWYLDEGDFYQDVRRRSGIAVKMRDQELRLLRSSKRYQNTNPLMQKQFEGNVNDLYEVRMNQLMITGKLYAEDMGWVWDMDKVTNPLYNIEPQQPMVTSAVTPAVTPIETPDIALSPLFQEKSLSMYKNVDQALGLTQRVSSTSGGVHSSTEEALTRGTPEYDAELERRGLNPNAYVFTKEGEKQLLLWSQKLNDKDIPQEEWQAYKASIEAEILAQYPTLTKKEVEDLYTELKMFGSSGALLGRNEGVWRKLGKSDAVAPTPPVATPAPVSTERLTDIEMDQQVENILELGEANRIKAMEGDYTGVTRSFDPTGGKLDLSNPDIRAGVTTGNATDELLRDLFADNLQSWNSYQKTAEDYSTDTIINEGNLFSHRYEFNQFIDSAASITKQLTADGGRVITDEVNLVSDVQGLHGKPDVIVIGTNGKVKIYDIKIVSGDLTNIDRTYQGDEHSRRDKYSYQLNKYAELLEEDGFEVEEIGLIPIRRDGSKISVQKQSRHQIIKFNRTSEPSSTKEIEMRTYESQAVAKEAVEEYDLTSSVPTDSSEDRGTANPWGTGIVVGMATWSAKAAVEGLIASHQDIKIVRNNMHLPVKELAKKLNIDWMTERYGGTNLPGMRRVDPKHHPNIEWTKHLKETVERENYYKGLKGKNATKLARKRLVKTVGKLMSKIFGKALTGVPMLSALLFNYSDAKDIAAKLTKDQRDVLDRVRKSVATEGIHETEALIYHQLGAFARSPGTKF
jgi:hypothetical protein